jgi:DNA-binding NarL/FixJ family response regulator
MASVGARHAVPAPLFTALLNHGENIMSYWQQVLNEVLNRQDPKQRAFFTCVKDYTKPSPSSSPMLTLAEPSPPKKIVKAPALLKKYGLGKAFPEVFLTRREAQVAFHLTQGLSVAKVAETLNLSRRTVEFYVNNMKCKLSCKSKSELVMKIMQSEFLALTDTRQWQ